MVDQATQLRRLVLRSVREEPLDSAPPPKLIVVCGGRCGAGVTTLSVHLAVAMAAQGAQAVLVDADLYQPDVAHLCGLPPQAGVVDVLAGRRDIHEVLQRGPAGVQVVPGCPAVGNLAVFSETAQRRLLRQLRSLGRYAEVVLIDAGCSGNEITRRFWQAADRIALVVTAEASSVMDAYAQIKQTVTEAQGRSTRGASRPGEQTVTDSDAWPIQLIVNKLGDRQAEDGVHRRIDLSCQRFLGFGVGCLGSVPDDAQFPAAAALAVPCLLRNSGSDAARQLETIAGRILQESRRKTMVAVAPGPPALRQEAEKMVTST